MEQEVHPLHIYPSDLAPSDSPALTPPPPTPPPPHLPLRLGPQLIGLGTEFRSEKIPRNRLGTVSVIPRKKVLIPRYSEFRGRANSEAGNGTEQSGIPRKNEVLRDRVNTEQNDF